MMMTTTAAMSMTEPPGGIIGFSREYVNVAAGTQAWVATPVRRIAHKSKK